MNPTVYVETSVISYLTSRQSRDLVIAAHQNITRTWWERAPSRFELVISPMVDDELQQGDPDAAMLRVEASRNIPILPASDHMFKIATLLQKNLNLPAKALADIYHIAYCIAYEVDFLVTWNCTHIANPHVLRKLRDYLIPPRFSCLQSLPLMH